MEVSVLWRCLYYEGVCIMEVSVLWRCLYYEGVCIMEVSVFNMEVSVRTCRGSTEPVNHSVHM